MSLPTPGHGLWRPRDPNQDFYDQYGSKDKYDAAVKTREDALAKIEKVLAPLKKANKKLYAEMYTKGVGLNDQKNQAIKDGNTALATTLQNFINQKAQQYEANSEKIDGYEKQIQAVQQAFEKKKVVKNTTPGPGTGVVKAPKNTQLKYFYNAPVVSSNNFLNKGSLPKMISAGSFPTGDAITFWSNSSGGKGTIQMDRQTNTAATKAEAKKTADANKVPFDDKLYGFKFQYNPTTVNMSWSGMMGANPVFEMLNKDPAVPIQTNLFTGTISFDIILNRIQDIAWFDGQGTGSIDGLYGKGITISPSEMVEIGNKGTMYDLEYLFKTLHGWVGYTNFKSTLSGSITNDPGWLPVRPVELHLGNKLRYRVRVSGLEVVHKIFSEKMVPILSVVTITCMRYWDGPPAPDAKKSTKK